MSFDENLIALRQAVTHTLGVIDGKLRNKANKTDVLTTEQIDARIQVLIGSAPETLDTLAEIAEALGNNPSFATTIAEELAKKATKTRVTELENQLGESLTALTDAFTQGAATIQNSTQEAS
ncbi:hypothetical protein [Halomonas colorata]|uniref:hypothetical protein n=1 Tax=Halomonas colorata TaxID=2742615 RepID=UPI00186799DA|nr:hypothetical protein [Halomonas colorata]